MGSHYKYYHDTETDEIISIDELKTEFLRMQKETPQEYNSFDEFLGCCMVNQNGTLETLRAYISELEDEITKILYTEYPLLEKAYREEIDARLNEIERLQQYL